jgi:hypothetical protein
MGLLSISPELMITIVGNKKAVPKTKEVLMV